MSYIERMIICKKKLVLLLACLMMVACMVIINTMRGKEKKTDYDFMNKKDKWYSWDKRYEENRHSAVDDEEEVKKIRNGKYIPPRRVVHLDLKGAPPKLSYVAELLPLLSSSGATDLLIEYEDMFPYWGSLQNISATTAYHMQEIAALLQAAKDNNLGVIPLVQTFGHLEFVLKLEQFKNLREEPSYPQSLCPSREEAVNMVRTMVNQIMEIHRDSTHIHIGCDEVYQLGQCRTCVRRLAVENEKSSADAYYQDRFLFLDHVKTVGSFVSKKGKIPLIWDDMLRNMPRSDIQNSGIGSIVEVMVWSYTEDIDRFLGHDTWRMYAQLFRGVWAASAFKGAFGEKEYVPDMYRHVQNHLTWLQVMEREEKEKHLPVKFKGLALTGWSRYDHFAVLCELLPVSIPSLVVNLMVVSLGGLEFAVSRRIHSALKCDNIKVLISLEELRQNPFQWDLTRCNWPGRKAFYLMNTYNIHRTEVDLLYSSAHDKSAWMTSWNVRHSFSSPWRVQEIMRTASYLPGAVKELESQARRVLAMVLEPWSVSEWVEQHPGVLADKLTQLAEIAGRLTDRTVWPRRPV
eukprot:TRINITY_DN27161_c0_g1_i6.p1 TRINITY_DN27161_c0_g1~~TRINITY_DN27161_c0_g1_i6.p1  ORF type:complete len:574 (-),score=170.82 TRINITY_DN27161_c0_g1_i6:154-1875(-)